MLHGYVQLYMYIYISRPCGHLTTQDGQVVLRVLIREFQDLDQQLHPLSDSTTGQRTGRTEENEFHNVCSNNEKPVIPVFKTCLGTIAYWFQVSWCQN